jgi:hypothetical protein
MYHQNVWYGPKFSLVHSYFTSLDISRACPKSRELHNEQAILTLGHTSDLQRPKSALTPFKARQRSLSVAKGILRLRVVGYGPGWMDGCYCLINNYICLYLMYTCTHSDFIVSKICPLGRTAHHRSFPMGFFFSNQ